MRIPMGHRTKAESALPQSGISPCFAILLLVLCGTVLGMHAERKQLTIKGGVYFGECVGYCFREVDITGTKVTWNWEDMTGQTKPRRKEVEGEISERELRDLVQSLDRRAFMSLDERIGCPDCADGGAEWIEVDFPDGVKKKVMFEFGKVPKSIAVLAQSLDKIRKKAKEPW